MNKIYYRVEELAEVLGMGESTIWHKAKVGEFPKPRKISPRITVWDANDVEGWRQQQKEKLTEGASDE
jgi:prophage regulatory protein